METVAKDLAPAIRRAGPGSWLSCCSQLLETILGNLIDAELQNAGFMFRLMAIA